jgi:hypothetical protein
LVGNAERGAPDTSLPFASFVAHTTSTFLASV